MDLRLFHIFRNTPLGRETLLQSLYFCEKVGASPVVYIPEHIKFLMYFENDVVQVDLDASYLRSPDTARSHVDELVKNAGMKPRYFTPKNFTASTLPDVPTNFDFMCCPRSISDLSSKIGLGYIGPRVRRIVKSARFPVLMSSPVFKPWKSVTVFFGGSVNAFKSLRLGLRICRATQMRLNIFTELEQGKDGSYYENLIRSEGLYEETSQSLDQWHRFEGGSLEEHLYTVPHDALIVVGAYGHTLIKEMMFGSMMEKIQATVSNNLLIVGPHYAGTS